MKRTLTFKNLFSILIFNLSVNSCFTQSLEWAKQLGGTSEDWGHSIAVDASGNVYTTGTFDSTADFDPGPAVYNLTANSSWNVYLSKLDASGNFVWAKSWTADYSYAVAIDPSGNVYTTGTFSGTVDFDPAPGGTFNLTSAGQSDIFISKIDPSGNFVWVIQMGGVWEDYGNALTVDGADNIFFAGGTANSGNEEITISKITSAGVVLWTEQMGGSSDDAATSIALDASGNILTTGAFVGTADFDPATGAADTFHLTSFGGIDIFISKLDSSGHFIWAKQLGGVSDESSNSIAVDVSGNVYTTGSFQESGDYNPGTAASDTLILSTPPFNFGDIFISKLDAAGNFAWAKQISNPTATCANFGTAITLDGSGNVYTTGNFVGISDFNPSTATADTFNLYSLTDYNAFIWKLNPSGGFEWAKQLADSEASVGTSITLDAFNSIYITGAFLGTCDFDPNSNIFNISSFGQTDAFVHKMDPTSPSGILERALTASLMLYPNPATVHLNVESSELWKCPSSITILSLLGEKLFETTLINQAKITIDVSKLPIGIYFVKLQNEKGTVVKKFVKE